MEDSEKRKERLRAIRVEAAQSNVTVSAEASGMPGSLTNPLAETSLAMPRQQESHATPRFDYYTDPMSAFSSNKRNKADQQIQQHYISSPSNPMGSPVAQFSPPLPGPTSGAYQIHSNQRSIPAHGHYDSAIPHVSQTGMARPSPFHQGTPDAWSGFRPQSVSSAPFRSTNRMASPFPVHQRNPGPWNRYGSQGNYNLPPNPCYAPRGNPSFNHEQGNAQWVSRTTSPGSRGGRGFGQVSSPSFRQNERRGQTFNSRDRVASGTIGAERFYDKSMEEDPWQNLEPVLWKSCSNASSSSLKSPGSSDSWLPKSITAKKPWVSEASIQSNNNSKQSLAEYLAASLDEAINDDLSV